MASERSKFKVIIVGAGPSGLLLSLLLAQQNISVLVLEAADKVDDSPRAAYYAPPANYELWRAGLLEEIHATCYFPRKFTWRKKDGTEIAAMGGENGIIPPDYLFRTLALPLGRLCEMMVMRLEGQPTAEIRWRSKVSAVGQSEGKAWVELEGKERFEADYVVGCDGGNSVVRKELFGGEFPGFTWDEQIVATNVYYDFSKFGYADSNFIVHPKDWYMAARLTQDGMWRVTYGDEAGLSREELIQRQPTRFEQILPGSPKQGEYKLVAVSPYKMHQRCAPNLRVGRILLAADAAHLTNPFGGLGLTGGIADVGSLYDCLLGISRGELDPDILDRYDEVRRDKFNSIVSPMSIRYFKMLWDQDPDTAGDNDPFFQMLKKTAMDKSLAETFKARLMDLRHDFTQYYTKS